MGEGLSARDNTRSAVITRGLAETAATRRSAAAAAEHGNVTILDWVTAAVARPGGVFHADGFHPKPDGRTCYAAAIESVFDELGV